MIVGTGADMAITTLDLANPEQASAAVSSDRLAPRHPSGDGTSAALARCRRAIW
jgi:hypothetical protein